LGSCGDDEQNGADSFVQGKLVYLPVSIGSVSVSALLDSGSTINIVSSKFYDSLGSSSKSGILNSQNSKVTLANGQNVNVLGAARIKLQITKTEQSVFIPVYVLRELSHPLILGTQFLMSMGIVLNFKSLCVHTDFETRNKVRSAYFITLPPHSSVVVKARVPRSVYVGSQGLCVPNDVMLEKGLVVAKSIVLVDMGHFVPVKILNVSDRSVNIGRNNVIAYFEPLFDHAISRLKNGTLCANVNSVGCREDDDTGDTVQYLMNDDFFNNISINSELDKEEIRRLQTMLLENKDVFVTDSSPDIGVTNVVQHTIHLKPDAVSKHHKPYRLPPEKREVLRHQLDELLRQGIIVPVDEHEDLPITSPIVLISKRNKPKETPVSISKEYSMTSYRFCCDFRYLNSQSQDFRYNIPNLQELTESFSERTPNYISSIDLSSGFFQMCISPQSTKYTAFNTCFGTYKFKRLPMGLKTSPNSFQMLMDKVFKGLTFRSVLCYIDDAIVASSTFEEHMKDLTDVFVRLRNAGLKINPKKCSFAKTSCEFLGHVISKDGISPPSDKLQAIESLPAPKNVNELRRTLGLFNWFRKFIPNFSAIASPLTKLLKSKARYLWNDEQDKAFRELKRLLLESPVLAFPRYDIEFRLAVDTSSKGVGYMLYQIHPDGTSRVVRFGSKGLTKWQSSYGPTKLELLGMVTAILDCSAYLDGKHFTVECDHQALKPLFQKQLRGAIYERWLALLQRYDFSIEYKSAAQMVVPDALSRNTEFPTMLSDSPDEEDPFFPYVDEPPRSITLPNGQQLSSLLNANDLCANFIDVHDVYDADTEDNIEYPAVALKTPHTVYQDHIRDPYGTRLSKTKTNQRPFRSITVSDEISVRPPVDDNEHLNRSLLSDNGHTEESFSTELGDNNHSDNGDTDVSQLPHAEQDINRKLGVTNEHIIQSQQNDPSLLPIISYLESGKLPEKQKLAREILLQHTDYEMFDGILYRSKIMKSKRSKATNPYQMVLSHDLLLKVVQVYHDSPMGGHGGIQDTIDKIREHFYYPKLATIVYDYVKSCDHCQKRKLTQNVTKTQITALPIPSAPFEVWEMDLYGKLPTTPDGFSYVFTAVDMFSKYLYAIPIRNKDALTVANALFQLFTTFGVCNTLISDQGSEFIANVTHELCKTLHVTQEFTPSFVHHCLGACERTHSTLAEKLTPYISRTRNSWKEFLSAIVFAMNSAVNASLGFSPYEILFGQRPKFPLTTQLPNFENFHKDIKSFMKGHIEKLEIIRQMTKENALDKKKKMENSANKTANDINIKEGDYVYLQVEPTGEGQKFQNKFAGPYVIDELPSPHTAILRESSNSSSRHTVHRDRLKLAYVREPTPSNYFSVTTCVKPKCFKSNSTQTNEIAQEQPRKSERIRRKPIRYRNSDHVDPNDMPTFSVSSETDGFHKVKRVLGQRNSQYLVQIVGEPAENAFWVPVSALNSKAKRAIEMNPPPVL
jgi:hypothetical protein